MDAPSGREDYMRLLPQSINGRADFVWCMTAITWGWTVDETKARLMEESTKAQENGERYADLTARNAALAVERRRDQPRRHRVATPGQR
jgi:hypothetical protein